MIMNIYIKTYHTKYILGMIKILSKKNSLNKKIFYSIKNKYIFIYIYTVNNYFLYKTLPIIQISFIQKNLQYFPYKL